jgi:uncharacterized membrane protein
MGELIALGFKDLYKADALMFAIRQLDRKGAIDLEDSAFVVKSPIGEVDYEQVYNMFFQFPVSGALYFGFLGAVCGWLIVTGYGGAIVGLQIGGILGWVAGAVAAWASNIGIKQSFIKEVGDYLVPGGAAVIFISRGPLTAESALELLTESGGTLLRTSPDSELVTRLRALQSIA